MNPQFQVTVTVPESKEEGLLLVAVMQRDDRKRRRETGSELNYIGYWIFEVRIIRISLLNSNHSNRLLVIVINNSGNLNVLAMDHRGRMRAAYSIGATSALTARWTIQCKDGPTRTSKKDVSIKECILVKTARKATRALFSVSIDCCGGVR